MPRIKLPSVSRRNFISSAAACAILPPIAFAAPPLAARFFDSVVLEKMADRDPTIEAPFVVDAQTHVWWREHGLRTMTPSGEHFLKSLSRARAAVMGKPGPIADMGRMVFGADMFLH